MNVRPDFTARRGIGRYDENEVTNVFHLASLAPKPEMPDVKKLLRFERNRLADRVRSMRRGSDHGIGGHNAGWNAAIDEVLKAMSDGD
jgi:hypothetical protein